MYQLEAHDMLVRSTSLGLHNKEIHKESLTSNLSYKYWTAQNQQSLGSFDNLEVGFQV